jgi:hypothetical protein
MQFSVTVGPYVLKKVQSPKKQSRQAEYDAGGFATVGPVSMSGVITLSLLLDAAMKLAR